MLSANLQAITFWPDGFAQQLGLFPIEGLKTLAGTVTIAGSPAPNGNSVEIYRWTGTGYTLVTTVLTGGGTGAFSASVSAGTYRALYDDATNRGISIQGTAGVSTFDITIGGGGDATAPTITIISPTPGTAPGDPGGFSLDWSVARMTPIVLEITDAAPGNRYQAIVCRYPGNPNELVVYRRGAFRGEWAALSSEAAITNGKRLTILPATGWPSSDALNDVVFEVDAIDSAGNLAT